MGRAGFTVVNLDRIGQGLYLCLCPGHGSDVNPDIGPDLCPEGDGRRRRQGGCGGRGGNRRRSTRLMIERGKNNNKHIGKPR
jgi:hypothetical protein